MRLSDTVALVTGASSGIGRAVALQLAAHGAQVIAHGRDPHRTQVVAAMAGGPAVLSDLARPDERARLAEQALDAFGRVDILINNAGSGWSGPFNQMPLPILRNLIEVDLHAQLDLTHRLLPQMLARRAGAIRFVTSVAGRTGVAGEAVYAAAKAGLDVFAESLRAEAHGSGVSVGVVIPGIVRTGFFDGRAPARKVPRPVSPDQVAEAVVTSLREDSAQTWIPRWLSLAPMVRAVAPALYRRLVVRYGEEQRLAPPRGDP